MDTFITFAVIFGLFGAMTWGFYNLIQETYGKNSPLKIERSYSVSELGYFTKFDNLFIYYVGIMAILIFSLIPVKVASNGNVFLPNLFIFSIGLAFATLVVYYIKIDYAYWIASKGVTLHFIPDSKQIIFEFPDKEYTVSEGDIERIEDTTTGGKVRIGITTYYLKNGASFILTDRIGGQWAIHEFFKHIPHNIIYTRFPPKL